GEGRGLRLTLLLPAACHLRGAPQPAQSNAIKKKKKKKASLSPLLPFPASARTPSLLPAPPAQAPLPWKPSGFARISQPPPLAILQYRGKADHDESGQQLAAAPGDGRLPLLEAVRRLRGQDCGPFLLYAMDSYWHSRCLKCSCCQAQLGDIGMSCYTKSGMILCRNDYIRSAKRSE
uniref:LIM zinc-binding domain-containing protein n=1 Tax=Callithrix jacchus TaxID=9483 RepID=A0A8I4A4Y5_CALJA